jgi:hypothetical protein
VGEHTGHPFTDVDAQSEPAAWVDVLDRLRREPVYAAYKARVAELVGAQAGGRYVEVGCGTGADAVADGGWFVRSFAIFVTRARTII